VSPRAARGVSFVSGIHRIDAMWHEAQAPTGAAVVAHPHPAHGGNMDHPVVVTTAERAAAAGLSALRFDFRGVRRSEGDRSDWKGHLEDWRRAAADARRRVLAGPLVGAGFSYGSRTLAALPQLEPDRCPPFSGVLLLAPATRVPTSRRDFGHLLLGRPLTDATLDPHVLHNLRQLPFPTQVVVGDLDVVAPAEELRANLPAHARLTVLPGLNHFFSRGTGAGALDTVAFVPAVDAALRRLM
jgi:hypothetical protein